eukprot:2176-Heterococcus_DN1.PRE.3
MQDSALLQLLTIVESVLSCSAAVCVCVAVKDAAIASSAVNMKLSTIASSRASRTLILRYAIYTAQYFMCMRSTWTWHVQRIIASTYIYIDAVSATLAAEQAEQAFAKR